MCDVRVTRCDSSAPSAVVMLFGWLGATHSQLKEYSMLYHDGGACTVRATASMLDTMRTSRLLATGLAVLRAVAALLASLPPCTPLVVHVFSGGGALVWEALRDASFAVGDGCFDGSASDAALLRLLRRRVRAEIFDSAPCRPLFGAAAVTARPACARWLLLQLLLVLELLCLALLSPFSSRRRHFETHWRRGAVAAGCASLYIYSRADRACRAAELESLLEARRAACAPAPAAGPLLPPFPVATAEDAQSLLLEACREGSAAAAAAALAAGASAAEADGLGNTPLHVAATRGC